MGTGAAVTKLTDATGSAVFGPLTSGPLDITLTETQKAGYKNASVTCGYNTGGSITTVPTGTDSAGSQVGVTFNATPLGSGGVTCTFLNAVPRTPTISTQVSASTITLGSSVTDLATVTGVAGVPTPTGAVTFKVYGPGDDTCTGAGVTVVGGNLRSGSVTSGSFTPTQVGTYHWIATYAGDANYAGVAGTCTDANETVVVNKATPTISTQVSASTITLGSSVTDLATVTGVAGVPTPTGAVTFKVYGPGDDDVHGRWGDGGRREPLGSVR